MSKPPKLTARERQVILLIAEGLAQKEIARKLGVSQKTAEIHAQRIRNKLNVRNAVMLTRYAISQGWLPIRIAPQENCTVSIETYKYEIEGVTGSGNTWQTRGIMEGDIADPASFHKLVMRESFEQLVNGRAVFGSPGAGCRGPYKVTRYTIELVKQ